MSDDIEKLKKENEELKKENRRLKKEIDIEARVEHEINKKMKHGCHKNTCYF